MHASSNYEIKIKGTEEEIKAIAEVVSEVVSDQGVTPDAIITIEETYECVWVEDITALAIQMAKAAPATEFSMSGVVDTSESAGEYMDFLIEYKNKKVVSKNSCWYVYMYAEEFEDYEEFSEVFLDDDDEPRFTKKQYKEFLKDQYYILESGEGDCVKNVPLEEEKEIELDI